MAMLLSSSASSSWLGNALPELPACMKMRQPRSRASRLRRLSVSSRLGKAVHLPLMFILTLSGLRFCAPAVVSLDKTILPDGALECLQAAQRVV